MIEEAAYSLFDILRIGAGIYVWKLHRDPGDEVSDRPTVTNNLFEGGF